MKTIIDLLTITFISVIVIDMTDITYHFKKFIWKLKNGYKPYKDYSLKPFDCSLCMSFWLNIIYLTVNRSISLKYILLTLIFAILTPIFRDMLQTTMDLLTVILEKAKPRQK